MFTQISIVPLHDTSTETQSAKTQTASYVPNHNIQKTKTDPRPPSPNSTNTSLYRHPNIAMRRSCMLQTTCDRCNLVTRFYDTRTLIQRGQCPDCFRANTEDVIEDLTLLNHANSEIGAEQVCVCPCECVDTDLPEDEDFVMHELGDDDLTTQLDERTERLVTTRYGFLTNVVLNEDTDEERRVFVEAPGHFAAASSHDIGRPAESSLVNSENTIGGAEARYLRRGLEPWEVEALHGSTGLSYEQVEERFPEMSRLTLPRPPRPHEPTQVPNLVCRNCHKTVTDEFMEWLRNGDVTLCGFCQLFRRPSNPEDDPDWYNYRPGNSASVAEDLDHCRCRCNCGFQQTPQDLRFIGEQAFPRVAANRPPRRVYDDAVERPRLPHITGVSIPYVIGHPDQIVREGLQDNLRDMFGLPELCIGENPDIRQCLIEGAEIALRNGRNAAILGLWDEAFRYFQAGAQIGRHFAQLDDENDLMLELFRYLRRVHRHLIPRDDVSQDSVRIEHVEAVLDANAIDDSEEEQVFG